MKVAWHEMPGNAPSETRPVGNGMILFATILAIRECVNNGLEHRGYLQKNTRARRITPYPYR